MHAGPLDPGDVRVLRGSRPGVVLLIGGADGDDPAPLLHNAGRLARARVRFPIVLAGNEAAREDALALLAATGRTVVACANVAPRPGELGPGPARAAVAELYAHHVLGGRGPAAAPRFRRLVRVGTPDAVSGGAALLAAMLGVRVLVVDIGCATTDVHLAVPGHAGAGRARPGLTTEGDLGMRAAAAGVLVEGQAEGVVDPVEADLLGPTVERMTTEVGYVPRDAGSAAEDRRIAALAAVLAVRRHRAAHEASGRVLGDIGLLVLTGGVFRRPGRERAGRRRRHRVQRHGAGAAAGEGPGGGGRRLRGHARGPARGRGPHGRRPLAAARPPARLTSADRQTCSGITARPGVGQHPPVGQPELQLRPGHGPGVGRAPGAEPVARDGVGAVADAARGVGDVVGPVGVEGQRLQDGARAGPRPDQRRPPSPAVRR